MSILFAHARIWELICFLPQQWKLALGFIGYLSVISKFFVLSNRRQFSTPTIFPISTDPELVCAFHSRRFRFISPYRPLDCPSSWVRLTIWRATFIFHPSWLLTSRILFITPSRCCSIIHFVVQHLREHWLPTPPSSPTAPSRICSLILNYPHFSAAWPVRSHTCLIRILQPLALPPQTPTYGSDSHCPFSPFSIDWPHILFSLPVSGPFLFWVCWARTAESISQ